jgi:hypothetical protein
MVHPISMIKSNNKYLGKPQLLPIVISSQKVSQNAHQNKKIQSLKTQSKMSISIPPKKNVS